MGNAYARLPSDEYAANLQQAIRCYEEALRVYTPETAPLDYAGIQNALGSVYAALPIGDRAQNLEHAITYYQRALHYRTPEISPLDYAGTQNNLGTALAQFLSSDLRASRAQAARCFQEALRFYTLETDPTERRLTARNLGNLHFNAQEWEAAHAAYQHAAIAGEMLYQAAALEAARQAELNEVWDIFHNDAYSLARMGHFTRAVERLETGRARALAEALARKQAALTLATVEDRTAFAQVRDRIRSLESAARASSTFTSDNATQRFVELSNNLALARQQLAEIVARINSYNPQFMPTELTFATIATIPQPHRPLVYLITTIQGSLALIVQAGVQTLTTEYAVWLDDFHAQDLDHLLWQEDVDGGTCSGYLMGQIGNDTPLLKRALDQVLPVLRVQLMQPLIKRLTELGFHQATLIPGGRLSLFPLHAAALDSLIVAYVPSARVLQSVKEALNARAELPPKLLGIGNPLTNVRPLSFARSEVEAIALLFAPNAYDLLYEDQATLSEVIKHQAEVTHLHFSCHGVFNVTEPLDSALLLAGDDRVTLRALLDGALDLSTVKLAVLSACQTGITDFDRVPNEAIGLPAGFLQAGAPGMISTLWPVVDLSTALLLIRFYRYHLQEGRDSATALHQAQTWLRNATAAEMELASWYERQYEASSRREQEIYKAMRYFRANPDTRPFTHPYYWAGFSFTGI